MPGSINNGFRWSRWRVKRSRHYRRMRNPQFCVSGKRPMLYYGSLTLRVYWVRLHYISPNTPFHSKIACNWLKSIISNLWASFHNGQEYISPYRMTQHFIFPYFSSFNIIHGPQEQQLATITTSNTISVLMTARAEKYCEIWLHMIFVIHNDGNILLPAH